MSFQDLEPIAKISKNSHPNHLNLNLTSDFFGAQCECSACRGGRRLRVRKHGSFAWEGEDRVTKNIAGYGTGAEVRGRSWTGTPDDAKGHLGGTFRLSVKLGEFKEIG